MNGIVRKFLLLISGAVITACGGGIDSTPTPDSAGAMQTGPTSTKPVLEQLALQSPENVLDSRLSNAKGPVEVWVSLTDQPLAAFKSAQLAKHGFDSQLRSLNKSGAEQAAAETSLKADLNSQRALLASKQRDVLGQLASFGAAELGRVHVSHNAIAVRVDAAQLKSIAAIAGVAAVRPVVHYQLSLADTVPYVGAAAAQAQGKDGTGVKVAVIDSGVDYTHRNLGGEGTDLAYAAAYGADPDDPKNTTRDGLFPTAKVVDGYDFVGDAWPDNGPRTEDPDPIDYEGHGTHVADIIAGRSLDGLHVGVAPGASLVAIKVCSSIASSCNGIALLKAIDFALDPNGDGDLSDAVDVINMSLGSDYGQQEDDLYLASQNAVNLGVVVVAAAGNASNRPYIVSSPSVAPGVISVAQTATPRDKAVPLLINAPAAIAGSYANTQLLDFAPLGAGVTGDVVHVGRGCPAAGAVPEDVYLADPAGKIALIDRGSCSVSLKVDRAAKAGATGVLIGLVAPGDAVAFSFGGGTMFVPSMVIQQSLSSAIKAQPASAVVNVTLSPTNSIPLIGSMASTSARGPSTSLQAIKPEIGAPGASISAVAGSGTGEEGFGGTSGATPMVAGAAAILIQAQPKRSALQIKALLMNSANTTVYTNAALLPGQLAPITRIGAGELRVDRALALTGDARNLASNSAALSFGFQTVSGWQTLEKKLRIENFSNQSKNYTVVASFRYANDEASGAVTVQVPASVRVNRNDRTDITVKLRIDGSKLPNWGLDGGVNGGNGASLDEPEYDGYITLTAGSERLSVPWHVLPQKSAATSSETDGDRAGTKITLRNSGVATGDFDVFALTGISPKESSASLPNPGDGFAFIDLRAVGVRLVEPGYLQFAINTFGRRSHPNYPAEFDIYIDTNRDTVPDYVLYNAEQGGFGATGSNLINVVNLTTGTSTAYFYNDASLDSANSIFTVPTAALGMTDDTTFDFSVYAIDNYFSGANTDGLENMTFTPTKPRIAVTDVTTGVPPRGSLKLGTVAVAGGAAASPSQKGLLFMYRQNEGSEADIVRLR